MDYWIPFATATSPWALVGLGVLSIYKGWWVPRPQHQAWVDRAEAECKAKEEALAANKILMEQNTLLIHKDDIALTALTAVRKKARES